MHVDDTIQNKTKGMSSQIWPRKWTEGKLTLFVGGTKT